MCVLCAALSIIGFFLLLLNWTVQNGILQIIWKQYAKLRSLLAQRVYGNNCKTSLFGAIQLYYTTVLQYTKYAMDLYNILCFVFCILFYNIFIVCNISRPVRLLALFCFAYSFLFFPFLFSLVFLFIIGSSLCCHSFSCFFYHHFCLVHVAVHFYCRYSLYIYSYIPKCC